MIDKHVVLFFYSQNHILDLFTSIISPACRSHYCLLRPTWFVYCNLICKYSCWLNNSIFCSSLLGIISSNMNGTNKEYRGKADMIH